MGIRAYLVLAMMGFACAAEAAVSLPKTPDTAPPDIVPGIEQVFLSWNAISGATGYIVQVTDSSDPSKSTTISVPSQKISGTPVTTTIHNLTNGQPYKISITANLAKGGTQVIAREVTVTPARNSPPANLKVANGKGQIALSWDPVGANSYSVFVWRFGEAPSTTPEQENITETKANIKSLKNGEALQNGATYEVAVKSIVLGQVVGSTLATGTPAMPSATAGELPDGCPTAVTSTPTTLGNVGILNSGGSVSAQGQITNTALPIYLGDSKPDFSTGDPAGQLKTWQAVSFMTNAAVPVSNATLSSYIHQELLGRDTALLNAYVSFGAGRADHSRCIYTWSTRENELNHIYLAHANRDDEVNPNQSLVYVTHGLGIRAIKNALAGDNAVAAMGTIYGGVGLDGPLLQQTNTNTANAGGVSLELFVSGNVLSRSTLDKLLGVSAAKSTFSAYGIKFQAFLNSQFSFNVAYTAGLDSFARKSIGNATIFSFNYNTGGAAK